CSCRRAAPPPRLPRVRSWSGGYAWNTASATRRGCTSSSSARDEACKPPWLPFVYSIGPRQEANGPEGWRLVFLSEHMQRQLLQRHEPLGLLIARVRSRIKQTVGELV